MMSWLNADVMTPRWWFWWSAICAGQVAIHGVIVIAGWLT